MPSSDPIQLDPVYRHHKSAIDAVRRALTSSHGLDFAMAFVDEHRASIINASRTRLCGRSEAAAVSQAQNLDRVYRGV